MQTSVGGHPQAGDADTRTAAEIDPVFTELATLATTLWHAPIAMVTVLGPERLQVLGADGLSRLVGVEAFAADGVDRQIAFCAHTVAADSTVIVRDALTDERFRHLPWVVGAPRVRFYAGAPLHGHDGSVLGAIFVLDTSPREPTEQQLQGLSTLASVASAALQSAHQSAGAALVMQGPTVVFANNNAAELLGEASPAALVGADLLSRRIDHVPADEAGCEYWRLRRVDGSEIAAEVRQRPIVWEGRPALQVELRDVTAAIEAYGELAESESRYRRLADTSTDMITLQAEDGSYRFVSRGCLALTGHAPEDIAGRSHLALIHPEDMVAFLDSHFQARTAGVDRFTMTYRLRHRDGSWVPVESLVQLIRDPQGLVVEFQTNTRDITERLLVEQSREQADRRFRVAMDNAPIGMALLGLDGRLIEVNRALCELFDVAESDLVGSRLDGVTHPEDLGHASAQLARILAGESDSLELETRYRRAGGEHVWTLRTASLVRAPEGEPSYFVVQIQDITAWKTIEETLSRQALSDPLTGLANRLMLTQRLTHALIAAKRRRTTVGLVFIDLDRFKAINDSLGHEAGDSILKQVAQRLARSIREEDTAVRLGGDEFVVLCEDLGGMSDLRLVANRIDTALSQPYRIGEREVDMTASLGLSVAHDDDADSLLRHSDAAMYEAKRRGRGRTQVYDPAERGDGQDTFAIEVELRRALDNDELRLFYQPVVSIIDGAVIAHEALVRWQHPERGMLAPSEFLDVAEDGPLISEIGTWVLRKACRDTAATESGEIGVNVSARQLGEPGFVELVRQTLAETGLAAHRLILEITETSILHATAPVLSATAAITELGVRFALDDFGTGQSSLSSLQKLPISYLKIDRSFTSQIGQSPATERLITGILRLAASTGLNVVAEGVEAPAQAAFLREQGCTEAQGYLYGRPQPRGAHGPIELEQVELEQVWPRSA